MSDVEVRDNPGQQRFEAWLDGERAGFAEYRVSGEVATFTHTEVDERFGGRGVGGALARGALDAVRERGLGVRPLCPFIRGWIEKHPDYQDLVGQR
ncbi:GNAT family N-acetyltransferase [Nocardioides insulae]|uniref:GNAT family N-acetyltransferase n=1 Tax=Nocardioides insulae TaxID=394734 RepID=UPI000417B3AA|nr:GNAT family N-acetyltransferase [Nocardioides insulae]